MKPGAIDLDSNHFTLLEALLDKHLPGVEVWAHGSRVKGTARLSSDLDLVVFSKDPQNYQVNELREALEESDLPFVVDVVCWRDLPETFRENIRACHVVVAPGRVDSTPSE